MSRKGFALFVALPIGTLIAYLLARGLLPERWQSFVYEENGPVELATAIFFALASVCAVTLARKRQHMPPFYSALFLIFALLCAFVALEEINYGQQLFGWQSPEWFQRNNHHHQINLHNLMGNRPSHILKHIGGYGTLVGFIVVPVVALCFKGAYRARHWTYYLLPRLELVICTSLAQLSSFLWDSPKSMLGDYWHQGWNEVRELYWAIAAVSYVLLMRGRLLAPDSAGESVEALEPRYSHVEAKNAA